MKFRDPKTGEVVGTDGCLGITNCNECPLSYEKNRMSFSCVWFKEYFPYEAARLMGYEVIEDETKKTFTQTELLAVLDKLADSCDTSNADESVTGYKLFDYHWKCGNANAVNFIKSALGIGRPEKTVKEVNMEKKDKPRLAEVLGVDVGENFGIKTYSGIQCDYHVESTGVLRAGIAMARGDILCWAINHPESIIRAPRLTEAELAICKAVGAKWVSKDDDSFTVDIWAEMPVKDGSSYTNPDDSGPLAVVKEFLFPSVHSSDCICVEEADGDA